MHEMDLIPDSYRRVQKSKKVLIGFAVLYVLLLSSIFVGKFVLNTRTSNIEAQLTQLQAQKKTVTEQNEKIRTLEQKRSVVMKQLDFVGLLKKGSVAGTTFQLFDRVLNDTVWMDEWTYQAVALEAQGHDKKNVYNINIKGKAVDHAALSAFVERLLAEPEVFDVVVTKSAMLNKTGNTVTFDMEVM